MAQAAGRGVNMGAAPAAGKAQAAGREVNMGADPAAGKALEDMAGRGETAGRGFAAEKASAAGTAEKGERAGKEGDTAGTVRGTQADMEAAEEAAGMAEADMGDMDLVSEDQDDPTSNRRLAAGMAVCRRSSSLYYGIRSSNIRARKRRERCPGNIRWALAWNRILSYKALRTRPR